MKKLILTLSIALASYFSYGQDNTFPTPSGNVGIGTTGPQHKLHVVNTGAVIGMVENTSSTADARVIAKNTLDQLQMGMDNTGGYFQLVGANSLRTIVNNAERMRVTSSGNVGIGTANPFGKLEVTGTVTAANYTHNKGISFTGTLEEPTAGYYSAGVNSVPVFGNGSGTMADVMGIYTGSYTKGASTTVTNSYGIFVDNNTMATTNSYGLFVNAPSGGATKNVAAYFGGNVGIGTTSPNAKLEVNGNIYLSSNENFVLLGTNPAANPYIQGNSSNDLFIGNNNGPRVTVLNGGNVGIGTTSPNENLSVAGSSTSGNISLVPGPTTYAGYKLMLTTQAADEGFNMTMGGTKIMSAYGYNDANEVGFGNLGHQNLLYLNSNGNVLINKTSQDNPTYKLDINGKTRANEIVVNSTGADFVFEPDYKLPKLSDVKSYIDKNHHLPEIPSAMEMQKNGMSVGELNTKLLQKVEELTLYLIEQQKQMDQIKQQLNSIIKK